MVGSRGQAERIPHFRHTGAAIEGRDTGKPWRPGAGIGLQPVFGGLGWFLSIREDRIHQRVLDRQREMQVLEQGADIRAFGEIADAHIGEDGFRAVLRAERVGRVVEILDPVFHVHGMRLPGEKHHHLMPPDRAVEFCEHSLLAGFHEIEIAQAELAGFDHAEDGAVAIVAGLDAVDLAAELILELRDVGEIMQAGIIGFLRHRQGVPRAGEAGADDIDGVRLAIGRTLDRFDRHPVAKEYVNILVLE